MSVSDMQWKREHRFSYLERRRMFTIRRGFNGYTILCIPLGKIEKEFEFKPTFKEKEFPLTTVQRYRKFEKRKRQDHINFLGLFWTVVSNEGKVINSCVLCLSPTPFIKILACPSDDKIYVTFHTKCEGEGDRETHSFTRRSWWWWRRRVFLVIFNDDRKGTILQNSP